MIDGGGGTDTLNVGANFTSTSDAQIVNIENITLTAPVTLNLSNQTEGFTITGSSGADLITGGSGNDIIVGAQNDTRLDGGAGTDTLNVGANFTSTSDAQIVNIENITLTAPVTLNLSNQTEGFTITGSQRCSGATITPVSYAATEQTSLTLKGTGISISDVDAGSGSMTVTLAVAEGTLNVAAGTSGAVVTNSGTWSVTHRHRGADRRPADQQCDQHGQLRRQHRHAECVVDADADRARQRQHRHRRRPRVGCHLDHQHHRRQRRSGGDDHAGELRGDRADEPHAQGHRDVDQRRGRRLRLDDRGRWR